MAKSVGMRTITGSHFEMPDSNHLTDSDEYKAAIVTHSLRSSKYSVCPGDNYISLAYYLQQPRPAVIALADHPTASIALGSTPEAFAVLHNLNLLAGSSNSVIAFDAYDGLDSFTQYHDRPCLAESGQGRLLFMRGYPSPQWLMEIGPKYKVDPDLYQRHMQFEVTDTQGRDDFTLSSLPSSAGRVFQLPVSTICSKVTVGRSRGSEDLGPLRRANVEALTKYYGNLKQTARIGDSIVRRYGVISKQFSVLEQTISINIVQQGNGWNAIIWLDNGRDLSQSVPGPWCPPPSIRSWETHFHPIIQHRPYIALQPHQAPNPSPSPTSHRWEASQNASLLPLSYGSTLDRTIMLHDALYALTELFQFAAFSEVQFLNMLRSLLTRELAGGAQDSHAVANLRYMKRLVDEHASRTAQTIALLAARADVDWPRARDAAQRAQADKSASLLHRDFLALEQDARSISAACQQGIEAIVSRQVFLESAKVVDNAERVRRLTLLATVFIPLSFTTSLFGMNFEQFGTGKLSVWVFVPASVVVVALSFGMYYFHGCDSFRRKRVG
ncbi:hypothetical protein K432DRAFT_408394 [Lepidopterella palustris CBS 459.81]|uniref:Cora-domain-containing protein n=1 Tax=Lepidopterella palustris CBS 459.81 TaxID=1314670 RepID=A0A8E2E2S3_9PEZI|nr:hypothetical protein K432DRAFT_408394 [Lepidopterella palustris CBS 459.81]